MGLQACIFADRTVLQAHAALDAALIVVLGGFERSQAHHVQQTEPGRQADGHGQSGCAL